MRGQGEVRDIKSRKMSRKSDKKIEEDMVHVGGREDCKMIEEEKARERLHAVHLILCPLLSLSHTLAVQWNRTTPR